MVFVLMSPVLGGCTDTLMARDLPPRQDCARRGGAWQVSDNGRVGTCRLPPGSHVAGWLIVPRHHADVGTMR